MAFTPKFYSQTKYTHTHNNVLCMCYTQNAEWCMVHNTYTYSNSLPIYVFILWTLCLLAYAAIAFFAAVASRYIISFNRPDRLAKRKIHENYSLGFFICSYSLSKFLALSFTPIDADERKKYTLNLYTNSDASVQNSKPIKKTNVPFFSTISSRLVSLSNFACTRV